jgi:rRNA maturation protein Nop10
MKETCIDCGQSALVQFDNEKLGIAGAYTIFCSACGTETYIPAETTARNRIEAFRDIVNNCSAKRVDGFLVDLFTASLLVQIYDALSPKGKEKFGIPKLDILVSWAWKQTG